SGLRAAYPSSRFGSRAGDVVTARVSDADLTAFESDPRVLAVSSARRLHPLLDVVRSSNSTGGLYLGVLTNGPSDLANADGTGVVVGIVDTGIDFKHLDFIKPGGSPGSYVSRVKYLWDQTQSSAAGYGFPSGFAYGREATEAQLESDINNGTNNFGEQDTDGHGSHVAGIAAGDGQTSGAFTGLAPKADLVIVKTDFYDSDIIDGINYIVQKAAALGEPAVINLSLGGQIDPHDGTSSFDTGIDAIAVDTPVVVAMGNDGTAGGDDPHAEADIFNANQSITFTANVDIPSGVAATDAELDFWLQSGAQASASLVVGGGACGSQVSGGGGSQTCAPAAAGTSGYIEDATGSMRPSGNAVQSGEVYIDVYNPSGLATGGFQVAVTLTCTSPSGCGRVDGFVDPAGQNVNFAAGSGYAVPQTLTMTSPATAKDVIAVGAYATKGSWKAYDGNIYQYTSPPTLGDLADFSSWGPTRDGRQKPDVAAPGFGVFSVLSADVPASTDQSTLNDPILKSTDGYHAIDQGTSMAAPVVTGIVATRLQGHPTRTVADIKTILHGLARTDAGVTADGAVPNDAFGYGKVSGSPQPAAAPSNLSVAAQGTSSITWSWDAALAGADGFDVYYATNPSSALATAVQPPVTLTGLAANATYQLYVRGEGAGIDGPLALFATTATYTSPPAGAPSAAPFASSATVSYAACSPGVCSGYVVEASPASDFSSGIVASATASSGQTSLTLNSLTAATTYYVRYAHLNQEGAPSYGPSASFETTNDLLAPTNPSFALISTGSIQLSWSSNPNPPGLSYAAQASTASDFSGTLLTLSGTSLLADFSGLSADTSYYFRVQATSGVARGPYLAAGPQATLPTAPTAPAQPFTIVAAKALDLAWTAAGDQPDTQFEADVSPNSSFSTLAASAAVRATSVVLSGLTPNTLYFVRVAAISRSGQVGAFTSLGSTVTLVDQPALPGQPFSAQTTSGFAFAWLDGGNPAGTAYRVAVSTDPGLASPAASTTTTALSASFSGLLSNERYFVGVAALNGVGAPTAYVATSTATAVAAPAAASVPVSTRTASVLGFAWSAGTLAAGTQYQADLSSSPAFASGVLSSTTYNAWADFSGLDANTTWYGRVRALSAYAPNPDGPYLAGAASGATLSVPPGGTPSFADVGFTSATVSWTPLPASPQSAAAEGYRVELSTSAAFAPPLYAADAGASASSAAVTGLTYATTYYARVAALNWEGLADYASAGSTTTTVPPLSSGTVASSGLSLAIPAAFPGVTSISIVVPPGAFPLGATVTAAAGVGTNPAGGVSNEAAGIVPLGADVGFELSAGGLEPLTPVRVVIAYDPAQLPPGQDERRLHLMRYDPAAGQWTLVPSQDDPSSHVLVAYVPHFSSYAPFFVAAGTDLSNVRVFPQPWEIGDSASAYWASALTFSGLPADARVRLMTLTGELVSDGTASAAGVYTWDGRTRFGRRAASGTYYAVFGSGSATKVRRVVLIR
ncbi:MAG: fibronectin type III domain-containing protein, partial [Elusimicrobia bacterium]|nr:fibronectin type III domain-containing protein [Elusimicrobiota bacterium]